MDDFSDAPLSLAEVRADRERKASLWSPREALISALRDLDKGELKAGALIVCVQVRDSPDTVNTRYYASCPDAHVAYGLLMATLFKMRD